MSSRRRSPGWRSGRRGSGGLRGSCCAQRCELPRARPRWPSGGGCCGRCTVRQPRSVAIPRRSALSRRDLRTTTTASSKTSTRPRCTSWIARNGGSSSGSCSVTTVEAAPRGRSRWPRRRSIGATPAILPSAGSATRRRCWKSTVTACLPIRCGVTAARRRTSSARSDCTLRRCSWKACPPSTR